MPVFSALTRLREKDHEVEANLGSTVSSRLAWAIQQYPVSGKKPTKKPDN
jgi:hypothetical protein